MGNVVVDLQYGVVVVVTGVVDVSGVVTEVVVLLGCVVEL